MVLIVSAVALTMPRMLQAEDEDNKKPNIVIIVADDLGYADLGCQGGREMSTPHIDSLATDGMKFTDAYVSGPVCAPTRAGLMTGRYQARFGYENLTGPVEVQIKTDLGVCTNEILLSQPMKAAGYRTAVIGKWHLGYNPKYRPNKRGFDYFFGFLPGGHDYFKWTTPPKGTRGGCIYQNEDQVEGEGYLTEKFTEEATEFIKRNRRQPFFLYLAYFNVHGPLAVPEKYCKGLPTSMPKDRRTMVGMIHALDTGVGQVLDALRETGLERNTLVIFLGDNGGEGRSCFDKGPLSGSKGTLWEGGIRVPFILRWPGRIPAGKIYSKPIIALDIFPTIVAAAGGQLPKDREIDGVNLLPYLTGAKVDSPHESLFWRYSPRGGSFAIRKGNMKLLIHRGQPAMLFDLAMDIGEKHDLSKEKPQVAECLKKELMAWNAKMLKASR